MSQFWSFDLSHYILQSNFNALVEKVGASAYNWKGEEGRERERESLISHQFSSLEHVGISMTS